MRLFTSKNKTKIVCTIGPASASQKVLEGMIRQGMSVARINFAHGGLTDHQMAIENIRGAASVVGERVAIIADLPGPKIRIGRLERESLVLDQGEDIVLTTSNVIGDLHHVSVSFANLPRVVKSGDIIYINDGSIKLKVKRVNDQEIHCEVLPGGPLRSHKGLNLPGMDLGTNAVTKQDQKYLAFALRQTWCGSGEYFLCPGSRGYWSLDHGYS